MDSSQQQARPDVDAQQSNHLAGKIQTWGPSAKQRRRIARHWRGYARLTIVLALLAALPTLLLPEIITIPVYNQYQPPVGNALLVVLGALLLLAAVPRPITIVFTALLTAGVLANTISAQFTPIADYLLVPGSGDHYFNLADLLIVSAIVCAPVLLYRLRPLLAARVRRRA